MRWPVVLASRNRPSPLARTRRTWSRGSGPPMVVVVTAMVVVVAGRVVVVVAAAAVVVDAGTVVVAATVVVVDGAVVVVEGTVVVVLEASTGTVMLGSSTKGSAGSGRPAIATPARPPTAITASANGHDLRMRSAKLAAHSQPRAGGFTSLDDASRRLASNLSRS